MKIAAAQLTSVPADVPANTRRMADLAGRARDRGAELLVFPELAPTGYEPEAVRARRDLWLSADDPRLDAIRASGVACVVNCAAPSDRTRAGDGSGDGGEDGERPVIGTFVFGADGELITSYRKQHLFEHEREVFAAGRSDGRFTLGGLRFALATCFDNHFPELVARGADDGCQVHLASSLYGTGGGVDELRTVYPNIARTHGMYVVVANHVGPAGAWTGCGRSALWAPDGAPLAQADAESTTVVVADVPPGHAGPGPA
ncbi:carbon-nitrogen hydrolase family protein [Streptomyces sp. NPDC004111]|uniref:carbon-nitrogen hydrolase family protein n=1 Tax=Streptomyces sp. NPDC004111 TaxID=3364690 RepID=UPI0036BF6142